MNRTSRVATVLLACAVAAVGIPAGTDAGDGVFLGYGFSEQYQQEYKVKFNQEVDLGNFAFSQLIDMEVTEKCVSMDDSVFVMEMRFDKVDAARMQFDDMVEDPMGERLTGQAVTFNVDRSGVTSDMKAVGYIDGWQQMEKVIKAIVDSWYAYLPNEELTEGATWKRDVGPRQEAGLTVEGQSEYEFKGMKEEKGRECARIEAASENRITGKQNTPMGVMNVEGGGKGESELYFCIDSSTIMKYKTKMEMKMDMTPEDGGDATGTVIAYTMEREIK